MKKKYESVRISVHVFGACDVLTTSGYAQIGDTIWSENPWGGIDKNVGEEV
jgi:hypothetical protein